MFPHLMSRTLTVLRGRPPLIFPPNPSSNPPNLMSQLRFFCRPVGRAGPILNLEGMGGKMKPRQLLKVVSDPVEANPVTVRSPVESVPVKSKQSCTGAGAKGNLIAVAVQELVHGDVVNKKSKEGPPSKKSEASEPASQLATEEEDSGQKIATKEAEKLHKCAECDRSFHNRHHLVHHVSLVHNGVEVFPCGLCPDLMFETKVDQLRHILEAHGRAPKNDKLMKPSRPPKIYNCQECTARFSSARDLTRHVEGVHAKLRPHQCTYCEKSFREARTLKHHVKRMHTEKKAYPCQQCDASFHSEDKLKGHVKFSHLTTKKYKCDICDAKFVKRNNLRKHIQIHTGAKDYECHFCEKSFSLVRNLNRHVVVFHGKIQK